MLGDFSQTLGAVLSKSLGLISRASGVTARCCTAVWVGVVIGKTVMQIGFLRFSRDSLGVNVWTCMKHVWTIHNMGSSLQMIAPWAGSPVFKRPIPYGMTTLLKCQLINQWLCDFFSCLGLVRVGDWEDRGQRNTEQDIIYDSQCFAQNTSIMQYIPQ